MKLRRLGVVVALALALGACASRGPLPAMPPGPAVELADTPFFAQEDYQCGPAALATVLVADGVAVTPEALVPQVYLPAQRGSLQAELTAATRRHERVPLALPQQLDAVTQSLASGKPVLVLLNLGRESRPVWHYAVVVGFDPERQTLLLRSGGERRQEMSLRRFDTAWARADRWALVVSRPDQVPASASPTNWVAAVAPFETQREFPLAERGYRAAAERWPQASLPLAALGNLHAVREDWLGAVEVYSQALEMEPAPLLYNNRAYVLAMLGCEDLAQADLRRGLAAAQTPQLRDLLQRTVAEVTARADSPLQCPEPALQSLLDPDDDPAQ